ncbi:MAG: glycosyl transferase family 1 [bacterium TMED217]|nr:MAG: glycosyl transferase family 1 [bacterium TMED217]|tara:strand:- start:1783 stop:2877 length:1095 start_codon:yes stop_codon:yes gene_type:complete
MKLLLIEPYFTGSHKQWAEGYQRHSAHEIKILSMKGQFWKWRMHGGAVTLANQFLKSNWKPDYILATDMLDLTTFLSLTRKISFNIPSSIYFHENQLSYPWSPRDRDIKKNRDSHYGFINYASALCADKVFFNSKFHLTSYLNALEKFLNTFPDQREISTVATIKNKSEVLQLGLDLSFFDKYHIKNNEQPIILWNHRWEYDKNPETFFKIIKKIKNTGCDFKLVVLGENFSQSPDIFNKAKKLFKENIIHWGYVKNLNDYAMWLWKSDIIPVTSNQEFFGASVMEAIYCNTWPILPNRLTYPELIPISLHQKHIYQDDDDLFNKVKWSIHNIDIIRKSKIKKIAAKYNWDKMAKIYDSKIKGL